MHSTTIEVIAMLSLSMAKMTERCGRTVPLSEVLELITQSGLDDEGSLDLMCVTAEYILNRM